MPANWYRSRLPAALLTLLLIGLLCGGAVAAQYTVDTLPFSQTLEKEGSSEYSEVLTYSYGGTWGNPLVDLVICTRNVQYWPSLTYVTLSMPKDYAVETKNGLDVYYKRPSDDTVQPARLYIQKKRNVLGVVTATVITIFPQNWEVGSATGLKMCPLYYDAACTQPVQFQGSTPGKTEHCLVGDEFFCGVYTRQLKSGTYYAMPPQSGAIGYTGIGYYEWLHDVEMSEAYGDFIEVSIDRHGEYSLIEAYSGNENIFRLSGTENINQIVPKTFGTNVTISAPSLSIFDEFIYQEVGGSVTGTNRTGSVTMTDHNGTSISGFEVTAENFYTGQSYTFSTDTDVAVISLPMDQTITIRNPQTGVYEEAPVGYYRFFGQKSGYRMLNEEGIRVSVMPEKYTSYQICDILVTPESGPLTGKHQFQIRSRADNSILQTGTISAKSATTGVWYNTTVTGGIANLILAYDTSNPISQYAGNYYVYATSPGYMDSEYATQIVVMPHTTYEIRDIHLTPIGGIPTSGNVTLRIQVFSETGPGIVNAKIFIAGVLGEGVSVWDTYTTSSTGYLEVSVPGNSTYDIVASAGGYYDSAHRIEVYTENPALIEMKLYFSGAPTVEPTTQPTGWPTITPTSRPTEVAPGNSPIDNFILMFVNMGFDSGMALWLTGLFLICVAAVIGHLIAGKFGAILAAPIGIVMTTGLGLIPFWGMVILLVIAALVIAKMVMR